MQFRKLIIPVLVLSGIFLSPWMIRTFVPGLPSIVEGRPKHFYILTQYSDETAPQLLHISSDKLIGDRVLNMNCPGSKEGWVDPRGMVDRIELTTKGKQHVILKVFQDDLGGQAETFEYLCWNGLTLPLFSTENVLGIGLPAYGMVTWAAASLLWVLLGALLWWVFRRKKKPTS